MVKPRPKSRFAAGGVAAFGLMFAEDAASWISYTLPIQFDERASVTVAIHVNGKGNRVRNVQVLRGARAAQGPVRGL